MPTQPPLLDTIIGYCIEAIKLQQMTGKRFLSTSCAQDKVLSPHNKAGGILHGLPYLFHDLDGFHTVLGWG